MWHLNSERQAKRIWLFAYTWHINPTENSFHFWIYIQEKCLWKSYTTVSQGALFTISPSSIIQISNNNRMNKYIGICSYHQLFCSNGYEQFTAKLNNDKSQKHEQKQFVLEYHYPQENEWERAWERLWFNNSLYISQWNG